MTAHFLSDHWGLLLQWQFPQRRQYSKYYSKDPAFFSRSDSHNRTQIYTNKPPSKKCQNGKAEKFASNFTLWYWDCEKPHACKTNHTVCWTSHRLFPLKFSLCLYLCKWRFIGEQVHTKVCNYFSLCFSCYQEIFLDHYLRGETQLQILNLHLIFKTKICISLLVSSSSADIHASEDLVGGE